MNLRQERIHQAQRAGLRNRMREAWHVPELKVDELLRAWAAEAKERGLTPGQVGYWRDGEEWLRQQAGSQE